MDLDYHSRAVQAWSAACHAEKEFLRQCWALNLNSSNVDKALAQMAEYEAARCHAIIN